MTFSIIISISQLLYLKKVEAKKLLMCADVLTLSLLCNWEMAESPKKLIKKVTTEEENFLCLLNDFYSSKAFLFQLF